MPLFTITPSDTDHAPVEVSSPDAAAVLHTIARLNCGEAEVLEDGIYVFSVRLDNNGLWHIHQRSEADAEPIPVYG
ncbi:hypothetical protein WG901_00290 [Novosphingobium sp. PS1R-30]|uniref:Uncharacterized protein n=1 Tax=Novosphingobium anseongense TaxID=3133436 RepID=A0ABU8RQ00_9SPHN|nr:MAG: hypothetical protein EOO76_10845 [Novosphingobium sp.]